MNKLKIRSHNMLSGVSTAGSASSWVYTIHSIMREFEKFGHMLSFITTNGIAGIDKKWLKYFRDCADPDIELVYCTPNNWPHRFSGLLAGTKRAKIRCAILNYESSILPPEWAAYHKYVDFILPSSEYCADVFLRAGIPEEKIVVVPLGIDLDLLSAPVDAGFELKTKKKFKILNLSIPHYRKNIIPLIEAYFEEFDASDDICLVVKTTIAGKKDHFELDVLQAVNQLKARYAHKNLPELELLEHRFNNISTLYKKTDALICASASEGFWLPGLEAMYNNNLVASIRYGGQLDYLEHNKNSLLIDAVEVRATPEMQYWSNATNALVGHPLKESIQKTMRNLYHNSDELHKKFDANMKATIEKYTWKRAAEIILDLYDNRKPKKVYGEMV